MNADVSFVEKYDLSKLPLYCGLFVNFDSAPGVGDTIINSMYVDALLKTFSGIELTVLSQHPEYYVGKEVLIVDPVRLVKKGRFEHNRQLLDPTCFAEFVRQNRYQFVFCLDFFLEDCLPKNVVVISPVFSDHVFYPLKIRVQGKEYRLAVGEHNHYDARRKCGENLGLIMPNDSPVLNVPNGPRYKLPQPYVILNPHASNSVKELDVDAWSSLSQKLKAACPYMTLVLSDGETEKHLKVQQEIAKKCTDIITLPKLALYDFLRVVKGAELCVTVDTGTAHMTHALKVPSVVLYVHQYNSQWVTPSSTPIEIRSGKPSIDEIVTKCVEKIMDLS